MRSSRLTGTIIFFNRRLFHILIVPLAVISALFVSGTDSSASSTLSDVLKFKSNHPAGKRSSEGEQTAYLKKPLLKPAARREAGEKRSGLADHDADKLLAHMLEKEVKKFYLPRLEMLFHDMNSILGINPAIEGEKEEPEQAKETTEENENFTIKGHIKNVRQFPVREDPKRREKYYVQVGTWKNFDYAQKMMAKVKKYYPDVYMVEHNNFNKVRIPGVMTRRHARIISEDIEEKFNLKALPVQKVQ